MLEEQLAKRGVKVERTVALESFTDQGNQVEAVLRKASGESETVTADWLLGCDGAHSTMRHGLGFTFDGTTQPSDWYLADVHISGLEPQDRLHIFWHKDGILAFFPITRGTLARHRRSRPGHRATPIVPIRPCRRSRP